MQITGRIFDIKEFAVNDGPGIRVTIFLKGCPLRCRWCHNPEGLSFEPQRNMKTGRIVGDEWTVEKLLGYCMKFKDCYELSNGGVTFSGGEATAQPVFLIAAARALRENGIHVNLDTSGYCNSETFRDILKNVDLVFYDMKCMDSALHEEMTGRGNALIIENLKMLASASVPYHIRVPLVKDVSDTAENRKSLLQFLETLPRKPVSVDFLPFNTLAPAKYETYGMEYKG